MAAALDSSPDARAAAALLTPEAVRERAAEMLAVGLDGGLGHWTVDLARLAPTAAEVAAVTRAAYPTLDVPFHARWRHFTVGGRDRWGKLVRGAAFPDARETARAGIDLAVVSVLLDAGAGMGWRYHEAASGEVFSKSEGLAIASFDMFVRGDFSSSQTAMLRADAEGLSGIAAEDVAAGFQVTEANPLVGLEGRADLIRRLGRAVAARPDLFATPTGLRPGGLVDHLAAKAVGGKLPAREILLALLDGLGSIWPGRIALGGRSLGDCWRHPVIRRDDATNGLVPFHKLSQWLAYSLCEPLGWAGIEVVDVDALTGLAEYRNGGLFMDAGVIALRDPGEAARAHAPESALIVEWRALTVALLDGIAPLVRAELGVPAATFPLAKVLEGGTWATGRKLARAARADGGPPLSIASDGTVF
jgi:hypothetical protein